MPAKPEAKRERAAKLKDVRGRKKKKIIEFKDGKSELQDPDNYWKAD